MSQTAPGRYSRNGLSWIEITTMFPSDERAEQWFAQTRWPTGPVCPHCQTAPIHSGAAHAAMPYRCRMCRKRVSVKTGTVLQDSKLGLQV